LVEISVGPVGLEHGELRIVAAAEAFVAEVAVEFEEIFVKPPTSRRFRYSSGAMRR
jgi:hypothetical protein